ncbi:MAG: hypothetical protein QM498_05415 [Desulfobacterium sp.]
MGTKSKVYTTDVVKNTERKFGECTEYVLAEVDGMPALFTRYQLGEAVARAKRNPEDIPGKSFWDFLNTPL